MMGGYLYLTLSDEAFGQIHYMENYEFREQFPSFSAFLHETQPEIAYMRCIEPGHHTVVAIDAPWAASLSLIR